MQAPQARAVVLLCVVGTSDEVSLSCALSLLRMQNAMSTVPMMIELHFVPSLDGAIDKLHKHETAVGMGVFDSTKGCHETFVPRAIQSGLDVVVGIYPLPGVDWERVRGQPQSEDPEFWGNTYSAKPVGERHAGGYVRVEDAGLGVAWISKKVTKDIAAAHPELVTEDGSAMFAVPAVVDGKRLSAEQRLLRLYGGKVWADLELPASSIGTMEFGGCVGARNVLR